MPLQGIMIRWNLYGDGFIDCRDGADETCAP